MDEYIPTRNLQEQLVRALDRVRADEAIGSRNADLLGKFVRDGALGKTVIGKAKKRLGPGRLLGCITHLSVLARHTRKDLDKISQEDMEGFILALESGQILSQCRRLVGNGTTTIAGTPLRASYQRDIKVTIRKFYKWLWGENKTFPKLVEWIDTRDEPEEINALNEDEVKRMIDRAKTSQHRALIQLLFDGGFRLGELLNVRLHHITLQTIHKEGESMRCFFIRIPYSKTMPRTVATPMHDTRKWLTYYLEDHPMQPTITTNGHIEAIDENAPLFPLSDNAARKIVQRAGKQALNKRVYPHLLRHTSATYWANKLPYFKYCKRFGWTMTSDMPRRYIDRSLPGLLPAIYARPETP